MQPSFLVDARWHLEWKWIIGAGMISMAMPVPDEIHAMHQRMKLPSDSSLVLMDVQHVYPPKTKETK